jgi:hypothetical protein
MMSDIIKLSNSFAEYYRYVDGIDTIDEQTIGLIQDAYGLSTFEYSNGDLIDIIENLIENFHLWHKLDAGEITWDDMNMNGASNE